MKKQFEVIDKECGYKVLGVYADFNIKEYPFVLKVHGEVNETYLTGDEAHDLFLFLEDIFGKKDITNE